MSVSVCMASYNGEKYIYQQINSILNELNESDELIIVDDCSRDGTIDIIESFEDNRIKLFVNPVNLGVVKTFEKAIIFSKNENIFLTDQDDIWIQGRVNLMMNVLKKSRCLLVSGNFILIDRKGDKIYNYFSPLDEEDSKKYFKNIKNIFLGTINYYGCAMALKRELKDYIVPFPNHTESHDLWIAMVANLIKKNVHIKDEVLNHRIHGENASVIKRNIFIKITTRIKYIYLLLIAFTRIIKRKSKNEKI